MASKVEGNASCPRASQPPGCLPPILPHQADADATLLGRQEVAAAAAQLLKVAGCSVKDLELGLSLGGRAVTRQLAIALLRWHCCK